MSLKDFGGFCCFSLNYSFTAILILYFTNKLGIEERLAIVFYHSLLLLLYLSIIFGTIIANSFIGRFTTVVLFSLVYTVGAALITTGTVETFSLPQLVFAAVGLALVTVGSGASKQCVAELGSEQFKLPDQANQAKKFLWILYYVSILGAFLGMLITPLLYSEFNCSGAGDCYPVAFGFSTVLVILSVVTFIPGVFFYTKTPVEGSMLVKVFKVIAVSSF